jgi:hypothetical protein
MEKMYMNPEKLIVPQVVEFRRYYATKIFITKFRSSELSLSNVTDDTQRCYKVICNKG